MYLESFENIVIFSRHALLNPHAYVITLESTRTQIVVGGKQLTDSSAPGKQADGCNCLDVCDCV